MGNFGDPRIKLGEHVIRMHWQIYILVPQSIQIYPYFYGNVRACMDENAEIWIWKHPAPPTFYACGMVCCHGHMEKAQKIWKLFVYSTMKDRLEALKFGNYCVHFHVA